MKKLSIHSFLFTNENSYYLFNTETLVKAKISQSLYHALSEGKLSNIDNDLLKILEEKKVIVEEEHQYDFFNKMEIETNRINYDMTNMTLFLIPTMGCNFCCPYCFEGVKDEVTMDSNTIQNIIKYIDNSAPQKLTLHWYGGEPLLRFDLMKKIYESIIKNTALKTINQSVVTNGYLINKKVVDFFRETHLENIQITLDGKKETHDKKRHLKGCFTGTFDKIIDNVRLLSKQLPESKISVRINVDKNNYKDFVDLYHYLHNECDFNDNICVYPALIKVYEQLGERLNETCFCNDEVFKLYDYYKSQGCEVVYFPKFHKHTCSICSLNMYTIGPKGEIYKCPEDANNPQKIIGNVNEGALKNEHLLLSYLNESSQFNRKECKHCLCFPICYGGCGKEYLKDKYHNGKLNYCHPLKNPEALKKAFLEDIKDNRKGVNSNLQFDIY